MHESSYSLPCPWIRPFRKERRICRGSEWPVTDFNWSRFPLLVTAFSPNPNCYRMLFNSFFSTLNFCHCQDPLIAGQHHFRIYVKGSFFWNNLNNNSNFSFSITSFFLHYSHFEVQHISRMLSNKRNPRGFSRQVSLFLLLFAGG